MGTHLKLDRDPQFEKKLHESLYNGSVDTIMAVPISLSLTLQNLIERIRCTQRQLCQLSNKGKLVRLHEGDPSTYNITRLQFRIVKSHLLPVQLW